MTRNDLPQTIARIHGKKYALRVSSFLFALFVLFSFLPFLIGWISSIYLFIFVPMDLALLYFASKLLTSQTIKEGREIIRRLYLILVIFIIAFVLMRIL